MAQNPEFTNTINVGSAAISVANTNRDGTGTMETVVTGGENGTLVEWVVIKATGTTTAGMVRLFLSNGTWTRLLEEVIVSAITPGAAVKTFEKVVSLGQKPVYYLPVNWTIKAATHNAEGFNVHAFGGDL